MASITLTVSEEKKVALNKEANEANLSLSAYILSQLGKPRYGEFEPFPTATPPLEDKPKTVSLRWIHDQGAIVGVVSNALENGFEVVAVFPDHDTGFYAVVAR